jgi:membrane-associated phospholipid phosphatase
MPHDDPDASERHRWALVRAAGSTRRRFAESWKALPPGGVWRYAVALAAGFVLTAALTAGLTTAARGAGERLRSWDERVLRRVEAGPMKFPDAILAESPGNLIYLVPLTLAAAVVAARAGRVLLAVTFVASYVLARPLIMLGWWLWDRPRPTLVAGGVAAPGLHSFPSGHVVLALAVYGLLAYVWCSASRSWVERVLAWGLLAAWVGLIGFARVRLGAHWPSDVIVGVPIGVAWLGVMIVALRRGEGAAGRGSGSPAE